ncbi:sensor histidine kinase [Ornithinimicrobium flavum]|uniref:sensor histidine kinase n=1 Tax=Ornithinimicrobium flavum TaxID=1288636 RepID=UPI00106F5949|nr:histidine kinase [Ornithinimicrobium flavum]
MIHVAAAVLAGSLDLVLTGVGMQWGTHDRWTGDRVSQVVPALVVVGMAALLLLRARRPFPVLLGTLALSTGLLLWIELAQPIFCVLVAVYTAAGRSGRMLGLPTLGLALVYGLVMGWVTLRSEPVLSSVDVAFAIIFFGLVLIAPWAFGRLDAVRLARTDTLAAEVERSAQESAHAERVRIARDLHDILAHSVSAMMMQAAGARALATSVTHDLPEDPRLSTVIKALGNIEGTGSQSLRELNRLLGVLRRPDGLDAEAEDPALLLARLQPDLDDLDRLLETPRQSGLVVQVHRSGHRGTVDPSVGGAAYRVIQESLTNALKHAGPGGLVDIYKTWSGETLQVQVRSRAGRESTDRPAAPSGGHGLLGLRERVELVGGSFEAGPAGDEFVVTATLPAHPPAAGPSTSTRRHPDDDPDDPPDPDDPEETP